MKKQQIKELFCIRCRKQNVDPEDICVYHPSGKEWCDLTGINKEKGRWPAMTYCKDKDYWPCCKKGRHVKGCRQAKTHATMKISDVKIHKGIFEATGC